MNIEPNYSTAMTIRRANAGFTLLELMVTITIAGILATVALPSFSNFVAGQRIKSSSFELMSSLVLARSEAIKRNCNVVVTPSGGNWQNGWTTTTAASCSGGTITLNQQAAFSGLGISGPASTLTYNASGRLASTSAALFEISSTKDSSISHRCINVDLSGRPNSKIKTGSTC